MSGMQQTSILAFLEVQPELNHRQEAVLSALRAIGPACNQQLADYLGWPINTVTPRVLELRDKALVKEDHKGVYARTGRTVIFWRVA